MPGKVEINMQSSIKIATKKKSNAKAVKVEEVAEELPAAAEPSKTKKYTSAKDLCVFLETPEELISLPPMRAKVDISKNGKTFLRCRHNGRTIEVYEADEGLVFPKGLVSGAAVNVHIDVRANDGIETKSLDDGRVYMTAFAVNCEVIG